MSALFLIIVALVVWWKVRPATGPFAKDPRGRATAKTVTSKTPQHLFTADGKMVFDREGRWNLVSVIKPKDYGTVYVNGENICMDPTCWKYPSNHEIVNAVKGGSRWDWDNKTSGIKLVDDRRTYWLVSPTPTWSQNVNDAGAFKLVAVKREQS
jgi:hypothetical protein